MLNADVHCGLLLNNPYLVSDGVLQGCFCMVGIIQVPHDYIAVVGWHLLWMKKLKQLLSAVMVKIGEEFASVRVGMAQVVRLLLHLGYIYYT